MERATFAGDQSYRSLKPSADILAIDNGASCKTHRAGMEQKRRRSPPYEASRHMHLTFFSSFFFFFSFTFFSSSCGRGVELGLFA